MIRVKYSTSPAVNAGPVSCIREGQWRSHRFVFISLFRFGSLDRENKCIMVTGCLVSIGCDDSRRSARSSGGHRGGREIKCPNAKTTNTSTSTSTLPNPTTSTDAARKSGGHDLVID
jgi:hypothetical protein